MLFDRDYMKEPPPRRSPRRGRRYSPSPQSVVKTLIIANIAVYVLQLLAPGFTDALVLRPRSVKDFQVWRFVTYMFAHSPASLFHILFNMWGVYLFGSGLERRLGSDKFTYLYMISGLVGGVSWLLFNWQYPNQAVLGASGAVFGLLIGAAMMFPNETIVLLIPPIPMKLKTFALVFGGIEVLMAINQGGHIAHIAHLGGAFGGYVYLMLITRPPWAPFSGIFDKLRGSRKDADAKRRRQQFKREDPPPKPSPGKRGESEASSEEVDRILDKIGSYGLDSLTQKERDTLNRARENLRGRRDGGDHA